MAENQFISTVLAAKILTLSPRTLEKYRLTGGGPPYYKLGRRVAYLTDDLRNWANQNRRSSTSDSGF
ncbi:unnamed protein product [marine sediment metagenome]|uniref:Helix-turn-helix domain-containing protein n=1 Tax=marine sediment metagenome TaxID=412755 RepID=X0RRK8_9ZZZZ